jgi:ceramide glucosyltransferase
MMLAIAAGALAAGAFVYCCLVAAAALRYRKDSRARLPDASPGISILKPLKGVDLGLRENLKSFFQQDYAGDWEIVFAVADGQDPALGVVAELVAGFPGVRVKTLVLGEPPWTNAKVWSLHHLLQAATHELVLMADSDIRVGPDLLRVVGAELAANPKLGVVTCPYRAVGGPSLWSELEAIGMNTEFLAGVLVARMLEGMRFTLGPTVAARKAAIEAVGGWEAFRDYLAEDFVLGQRVTAAGWDSILSRYVVEHRIGSEAWRKNFAHRLRWNRSTRRSRRAGYVGQVFTNPLPLFWLAAWAFSLGWGWWLAAAALRYGVGWVTARRVLDVPMSITWAWKLPLQDFLSLVFWVAGFGGRTIEWRGKRYQLLADGRIIPP